MISDTEHLLIYLLVISVPSLEKCLFRSAILKADFVVVVIELYEFLIDFGY